MYCSECGSQVEGAKFCSNCGFQIKKPQPSNQTATVPVYEEDEVEESGARRPNPWLLSAFILFLIVAAITFWMSSTKVDLSSKTTGFTVDECYQIMVEAGAPEIIGTQVMCKMESDKGQESFDSYMVSFIEANATFQEQMKEVTGQ